MLELITEIVINSKPQVSLRNKLYYCSLNHKVYETPRPIVASLLHDNCVLRLTNSVLPITEAYMITNHSQTFVILCGNTISLSQGKRFYYWHLHSDITYLTLVHVNFEELSCLVSSTKFIIFRRYCLTRRAPIRSEMK